MNLYLDTATEDFVLVLFNDDFEVIDHVLYLNYRKKVDLIVNECLNMMKKHNLEYKDLNGLYTNIGPGFFTGVRASLVFFRTIALLTKVPLFTTTSFDILLKQNNQSILTLDAQGNKMYFFDKEMYQKNNDIKKSITVKTKDQTVIDKINYQSMIDNFKLYKDIFNQETNALLTEPLYIKSPQIGAIK
ncbi:tRNA (adenosine(37)-N6)-threonylcarbamoyltransferase complex dimerization subunit type 1 TsaB [Mycoplasma sp. NEAQ87857]|uniref:tRNA (adenosine(37)-N6)-threonylcarbamoyltransferase complex dimerization subunit type 1 TsaB n=1 Tax=Mycoplasma sp. NEAQ87857 TaxID=2683967 RepID=UPI001317EC6B|nr:tRNA (adenosine(37)-N6)-threonylcarbamoyltransferase complex dimerization subunit type 1 TsaB [Mycoplasma sp. NEAQ87857]QGZ97955.1 tRNA (adenosine(37)-N6)-threonylcarbamoyltransferase complex dimerization subunit type 1 TsaB [Mycoplasma sp. NEAQ87857]